MKNIYNYLHNICKLILLVFLIFCCNNKATEEAGKETSTQGPGSGTSKEDPAKELDNAIKTKASIDRVQELFTKAYGDNPSQSQLNALLSFAVRQSDHPEVVDMLISKGASKNIKDPFDKGNLLHRAVEGNNTEVLTHLITIHKLDINAQNQHGYTPLQVAIRKENLEMMRVLIEKGADVNITTGAFTDAALHCAVDRKSNT